MMNDLILTAEHEKKPIGVKLLFLIEVENFYQKQQLHSKKTFQHVFFFVEKKQYVSCLSSYEF